MAGVAAKINTTITAGRLTDAEVYWRTLQPWLLESGYQLRERFQPDWTPSWLKSKKRAMSSPDGIWLFSGQLIDAVKLEDDSRVALKKFRKSVHPFEEDISKYLSSEPLASDPRNHCVPILETLYPPGDEDTVILVMPLLRAYDSPRFDTVGEVMDCFRQLFEGLQFMHERHVAHRDINANNFMLDGRNLYPGGYHPLSPKETYDLTHLAKHLTRTQLPPKYYIIDFGISRRYKPEDSPPLEPPIEGGDRTVPEFQTSDEPRDPFPTDVYYAGNFIRQQFLEGHPLLASVRGREGFEFMRPLINDMVQDDPSKRPTMNEVLRRFEEITSSLSAVRLRSRVVPRTDSALKSFLLTFPHWWRKASYIIRRLPAVPSAPRLGISWSLKAPMYFSCLVYCAANCCQSILDVGTEMSELVCSPFLKPVKRSWKGGRKGCTRPVRQVSSSRAFMSEGNSLILHFRSSALAPSATLRIQK